MVRCWEPTGGKRAVLHACGRRTLCYSVDTRSLPCMLHLLNIYSIYTSYAEDYWQYVTFYCDDRTRGGCPRPFAQHVSNRTTITNRLVQDELTGPAHVRDDAHYLMRI